MLFLNSFKDYSFLLSNMSESLQSNFYESQYLENFNHFIEQLKVIFPNEEFNKLLSEIENYSDHVKIARCQVFSSSIRDENFDLFLKSKIKVFSHKTEETKTISESLFGEKLSLKNLLNNQPNEVKNIIWTNLHTLCFFSELLKPEELKDDERVFKLNRLINKDKNTTENVDNDPTSNINNDTKKKLQDMLGVNVNNETTAMIDDIVESFEKVLTNQSGSNPLSGIMEISQMISVKYANKINKGDIELDKLMQAITSKVPGMDQMMNGMMGGSKDKAKPKEKILMDENFSTANVEVGINKEEESKGINISGILKMADQIGVIPGGKQSSSQEPNFEGVMNGIPGIGKMMEMMQKLENTNTQEDAEALKLEMDTFLQSELGVDIDKLNEQLESTSKQFQEQN
jgi:hypothetical protein